MFRRVQVQESGKSKVASASANKKAVEVFWNELDMKNPGSGNGVVKLVGGKVVYSTFIYYAPKEGQEERAFNPGGHYYEYFKSEHGIVPKVVGSEILESGIKAYKWDRAYSVTLDFSEV